MTDRFSEAYICSAYKGYKYWLVKYHMLLNQLINHSVNSSSHSVNGDIAIQWEWSDFDPSQNRNPLTDYDKTLHNWLSPRDEHITRNWCQWTLREHLSKYVKYKALSFFILIYFFPGSSTEVIRGRIFMHSVSNYAQSRKEVLFWGLHDDRKHLGGQIPKKPSKLGVNMLCRASQLRVNEDWRHRRMTSLARYRLAA